MKNLFKLFTWKAFKKHAIGYLTKGPFSFLKKLSFKALTMNQYAMIAIAAAALVGGIAWWILKPSGPLSGKWEGPFTSIEDIGGTRCEATGKIVLELQQQGKKLSGEARFINLKIESFYEDRIPIPCAAPLDTYTSAALVGEVTDTGFTFDTLYGSRIFSGSIVGGGMLLDIEKCLIQLTGGCKPSASNFTLNLSKK